MHTLEFGEQGPRVAFCHGLFGQGRNWAQVGKALADTHRVALIDLPNHGRSEWTPRWDYIEVADQVASLFSADDPVEVVGHSMGGKVAMVLALRYPHLVARLCVVDMAPVDYRSATEFTRYVQGMRSLDLSAIKTRADADAAMTETAPDPGVRAFLLQNLQRDADGWRWRANLEGLGQSLDKLAGWPAGELTDCQPYDGPTLFVSGANSAYVSEDGMAAATRYFPRARRVTVKNAGHWVHSEQPAVFLDVLRQFLT